MTSSPILDVMSELMATMPTPARRELHVAEPVWRFLRDRYAKAVSPAPAAALMGAPVVLDDALTGGQWQLVEDGSVVKSGDMAPAPAGMVVLYDPHAGWLAVDESILSPSWPPPTGW